MANGAGLRETFVNNISAGFVVAPARKARRLAKVWIKWARWLALNKSLMGQYAVHVDQISFALAMEELGVDVEHLPATLNTILHLLPQVERPVALHLSSGHMPIFPQAFDERGRLVAGCFAGFACPKVIDRFNSMIDNARAVIKEMPSLACHAEKLLNPGWIR
jgi:hypothetical protein